MLGSHLCLNYDSEGDQLNGDEIENSRYSPNDSSDKSDKLGTF